MICPVCRKISEYEYEGDFYICKNCDCRTTFLQIKK